MWIVIFLGGALLTGYACTDRRSENRAADSSAGIVGISFKQNGKICFFLRTVGENTN